MADSEYPDAGGASRGVPGPFYGLRLGQGRGKVWVERIAYERFPFDDSPVVAADCRRVSPLLPGREAARGFCIDYTATTPGRCVTGEQAESLIPKLEKVASC